MKRLTLILAVGALALPAAALGKGPTAATMDGPGGGSISFSGDEGSGPLGHLTQQSGWFDAAFEQVPSPLLPGKPAGDLGPKYTVTYTVPGPNNDTFTIRQDIYPYADPAPVTYMAPGQPLFDTETHGGWFQATPNLKETLVSAGLPANAPGASTSDGSSFPTVPVSVLAIALLFALATAFVARRRTRPAAA